MPSKKNKSAKKKTKQQRNRSNVVGHNLTFPLDVIGVIAEILQQQLQLKSLASLNVVSHAVHLETLPILYKIVLHRFHGSNQKERWERLKRSAGARFIQFMVEIDVGWPKSCTRREDQSLPFHDLSEIPETLGKASVAIVHNCDASINIIFAYIWDNYAYGGRDIHSLVDSVELVYKLCKVDEVPKGDDGRINRVRIICQSFKSAFITVNTATTSRYPISGSSVVVDEVDFDEIPPSSSQDISQAVSNIITEFAALVKPQKPFRPRKRENQGLFILWPENQRALRQTVRGIASALDRSPKLVTLNLYVYCPVRFNIEELRALFDLIVKQYHHATTIAGRGEQFKILHTGQGVSDWSSGIYTCKDRSTHCHITFEDGAGREVAGDVVEICGDEIVAKRGELLEPAPAT